MGLCLVGNPSSDTALACYQVQGQGAAYQMQGLVELNIEKKHYTMNSNCLREIFSTSWQNDSLQMDILKKTLEFFQAKLTENQQSSITLH